MTNKNYVIIVAGGMGARMGAAVPKQFLLLNGRPVLMHTIEAFYHTGISPQIITVLPANFHNHWLYLCSEYNFTVPHQLVTGGETRFHSVKRGLDVIAGHTEALIAIHDAVRPLPGKQIIEESYRHALLHGNAVTSVKSRDSVRQLKDGASVSLTRDEIFLVQTPQTFRLSLLKKAYEQPYSDKFTDDASVAEAAGFPISLIEGSYRNIKITFPEDIALVELLMVHSS